MRPVTMTGVVSDHTGLRDTVVRIDWPRVGRVTHFAQQFRVSGTPLLYAGRARKSSARPNRSGLRYRIGKLLEFGAGRPVGHWGGRYLWQVEGSEEFVLAWRPSPDGASPAHEEAELIAEFEATFARLPFANMKRGDRS